MRRQINIKCSYEPMASTCSDLVPHAVTTPLQGARAHIPLCARGRLPQCKKKKNVGKNETRKKMCYLETLTIDNWLIAT